MANDINAAGSVTTFKPLKTHAHTHTHLLKAKLVHMNLRNLSVATFFSFNETVEILRHVTHIRDGRFETLRSVHLPDKLSFPFPAASRENIYHMLRQVLFYSNSLPRGKQNTG